MTDTRAGGGPLGDKTILVSPQPIALKNNIAFLEELVAYGGMGEVWRAKRGNAMSILAERMVWGEENPVLFGLNDIPFEAPTTKLDDWVPKPITDKDHIKQIYTAAYAMWQEYAELHKKDPKAAKEHYHSLLELIDPYFLESSQLAVKVLKPRTRENEELDASVQKEFISRFQKENLILQKLHHKNIVKRLGIVNDPKMGYCLLFEWIEGKTLDELQKQLPGQKVPLDQAAKIGYQLADALQYAHGQGVIHRDLKPANIKIREDGSVVIIDFGIGKWVDDDEGLTLQNKPVGTPHFMAPEQVRAEKITEETDTFQLGTVLYTAVTGKRAYEITDFTVLAHSLGQLDVPHPSYVWKHGTGISPEFATTIEVARSKVPGDRWKMSEMKAELGDIIKKQKHAEQGDQKQLTPAELQAELDRTRRQRKKLRYKEQELDTRLNYKTIEQTIAEINGLYETGELTEAGARIKELFEKLPKTVRYDPLKDRLGTLERDVNVALSNKSATGLLRGAKKYNDSQDYVAFGDCLKRAETAVQNDDVKQKHPVLVEEYTGLKKEFEAYGPFVDMFNTVQSSFVRPILDGIDSIQKRYDDKTELQKKPIEEAEFNGLFDKIKSARTMLSGIPADKIGIQYRNAGETLDNNEMILNGLKKLIFEKN